MNVGRTIVILVFLALTVAPLANRRNRALRIVCVSVLAFCALCQVHFSLRTAARNVTIPSTERSKTRVAYGEAWQDGRVAVQDQVNLILVPLAALIAGLWVIAIVPMKEEAGDSDEASEATSKPAPGAGS